MQINVSKQEGLQGSVPDASWQQELIFSSAKLLWQPHLQILCLSLLLYPHLIYYSCHYSAGSLIPRPFPDFISAAVEKKTTSRTGNGGLG